MPTVDDFAIWWTNSEEGSALDNSPYVQEDGHEFYEFARGWPEYLQDEIRSRIGRAGRGRLWVATEHMGLFPDLPKDLDYRRVSECGGVVFLKEHLHHLAGMPGLVTDRHLNAIPH
jgi:hypothetical protein